MSDQRLRELERRWRESGSATDEAAWLQERVRIGDLERRRLELAAYAGHGAACLCLPGLEVPEELEAWVRGLEQWQAELALWVYAEISVRQSAPQETEQLERVLALIRERFSSGGMAELAGAEVLRRPVCANVKVLALALHYLAREPHYPPDNDPEVSEARRRIIERFPVLDAERWRYNHAELQGGAWQHVFRYLRSPDRETRQTIPASKGWEPKALHRACPPQRQGVLAGLLLGLEDTRADRAHARALVRSWALKGSG